MDKETLDSALQAEYLHLQKVIEDFDSRTLTIKTWSISFSCVALISAFVSHAASVLLISSSSALLFWFLEASWKKFQYIYYERCNEIEKHFRSDLKLNCAFQISSSWQECWRSKRSPSLTKILSWPHVALPHFLIAVLGFTLFCLTYNGFLKI